MLIKNILYVINSLLLINQLPFKNSNLFFYFLFPLINDELTESITVNQYLCHNLGYKKYKLFNVAKFIFALPSFDWCNSHCTELDVEWKFTFCLKITTKWNLTKNYTKRLKSAKYNKRKYNSCNKRTPLKVNELQPDESILRLIVWWNFVT